MITRIQAARYRCFKKLDVELGEFHVFVGVNGSGKTTLLDIPVLLGDMLRERGSLAAVFTQKREDQPPRAQALSEVFFGGRGRSFVLAVEARVPDWLEEGVRPERRDKGSDEIFAEGFEADKQQADYLRYEIRVEIHRNRELRVASEHLVGFSGERPALSDREWMRGKAAAQLPLKPILKRERGEGPVLFSDSGREFALEGLDATPTLLALPAVQFAPIPAFRAARWFHDLLVHQTVFLDPDFDGLRAASPVGLPDRVMPSARNFPWLALDLKQKDPDWFRYWVEHVRSALPEIGAVDVRRREDDGSAYFALTYQGGRTATFSGISEGTLRFMVLTLLPYLRGYPALVLSEKPETGVHPLAVHELWQSLSSLYGAQALFTSYSTVSLVHVELDQILCTCIRKDGAVTVIPCRNHPRLKGWQNEIGLGRLFAAGEMA